MARTGSAHASGREKRIGKRGRKQCKNIVNKTRIAEKLYLNGRLVLPHPCRFFMIYRLLPNEEWGTLNPHNPFIVFVSSPVFPSPSWFRDSVRNTPTFFSTDRAPGEGDSTTELVFFYLVSFRYFVSSLIWEVWPLCMSVGLWRVLYIASDSINQVYFGYFLFLFIAVFRAREP